MNISERRDIALQIAKAIGIPQEEFDTARGLVQRVAKDVDGPWVILMTWAAMSIIGMRDDVTKAIANHYEAIEALRANDERIVAYIKEVLSQADQLQPEGGDPMLGDDPHAG